MTRALCFELGLVLGLGSLAFEKQERGSSKYFKVQRPKTKDANGFE